MIHPDLYTKTSLIQQIEDLSHAKTAVTSVKVAHLVTSYFVAYLVGDDGTLTYSAEEIEDFYRWASQALFYSRAKNEADMDDSLIGRSTHEANYALSMLIDTAATTRIVEEILTAPIIEWESTQASVLELGAGSALPLVAGVIRARRQGKTEVDALGIELDPIVAGRSHLLVSRLVGGTVQSGNTARLALYQWLSKPPDIILNENLSSPGTPLYAKDPLKDREIYEPFLPNIYYLDQVFGDALCSSYHFPRATYLLDPYKAPFQIPLGLRPHSTDHPFWISMERLLQSDTYASQDADIAALALLCRLSRSTVPYSILLGTENTPLREVGSWYRGELTLNDVALQRRWP